MAERETVKRFVIRDEYGDGQTSLNSLSLSDELVEEILIRLPTNTLFRCKCVCKRWKVLISASSFVERVKSLPTLTSGFFLCVDLPDALTKPELCYYETCTNVVQLDGSLSFLQKSIVPVASHEGFLLCVERPDSGVFSVTDSFNYILCNPYAKQWIPLPKPRSDHRIKFVTLYCYKKQITNTEAFEFKVISLIDVFCHNVIELEIYSSDTGQWKESTIFHHLGFLRPSCPVVLLDGSIHFWNPDNRHLCVYNLEEESIRFMELPVGSFSISAMGHLGVSAESLYYSEGTMNYFRVWVLDGAEWFLKHSIDFESLMDELEETLESDYLFYPVAFHPLNDNIVLVRLIHSPKIVLYHMDTTRIEVMKNIDSSLYFPVITYALPAWHPFIKNHYLHSTEHLYLSTEKKIISLEISYPTPTKSKLNFGVSIGSDLVHSDTYPYEARKVIGNSNQYVIRGEIVCMRYSRFLVKGDLTSREGWLLPKEVDKENQKKKGDVDKNSRPESMDIKIWIWRSFSSLLGWDRNLVLV